MGAGLGAGVGAGLDLGWQEAEVQVFHTQKEVNLGEVAQAAEGGAVGGAIGGAVGG